MPYVLQVLRFMRDASLRERKALGKCEEHVGYMTPRFLTMQAAADYYDKHNPHLRGLHALGNWWSDWDPVTLLLCVVRDTTGISTHDIRLPPYPATDKESESSDNYNT